MTFQKGHIPYFSFKGKSHTIKTKSIISKKRKEWLKSNKLPWEGKKFSQSHREKLSLAQKKRFSDKTKHPRWKGGRIIQSGGYVMIYQPTHPFCINSGYVSEHRLVMEKIIGRYLKPEERVHHIDGDKQNNKKDNLMLFACESDHQKHHGKIKIQSQVSLPS